MRGSLSNSTPFRKLQRVNERRDSCLSVSRGYVPTLTGTEPCPTYTNKQIAEMIAECRGCWAGTMKTGVEPYQVTDAEGLLYWLTVSAEGCAENAGVAYVKSGARSGSVRDVERDLGAVHARGDDAH
jgi:hypothetical protein